MPSGRFLRSPAAAAKSAQESARSGTPATPTAPSTKTMSSGLASSRCEARSRALSRTARAAWCTADPPCCIEREAELFGRNLRERRFMALAEGSGPAAHGRSPVRLDPDRSPFRADADCSDLDVDRKADTELQTFAALAPPSLLRAQLPISRDLEHLVEGPLVLA